MGRGKNTLAPATLDRRNNSRPAQEDRFAAVFGTRRGSGRVEPTPEQEAAERDGLLRHMVKPNGDTYYYNNDSTMNCLHRETGPAVELADGTRKWYRNNKLHRVDAPAVELSDGTQMWYQNGKRHREDGPAIKDPGGSCEWYWHGDLHRIGGPALESADGRREWWVNGERHRDDGPAVEDADGSREWWVNGKLLRKSGPEEIDDKAP